MRSTPGINRAFLVAIDDLMAGIGGCLMFHTSGPWFIVFTVWFLFGISGAIICAINVNKEV